MNRADDMIISLSLENWKSHSNSSFAFGKGTNVLIGRMGSGKSSVLDALCFALYGTFPKMQRRDQTVEDLVAANSGASAAVVKLEFDKGGKNYTVTRKVGKKTSEAEVQLEGKLVQKGAKAATDYVVGVLGVDYELFTRAIYSEQNRIDYLLSLNPKQRKGEIDRLLGLGQFDEAREAAQSAYSKLSEAATANSQEAGEQRMAELKGKIVEQEAALATKKEQQSQLKQKTEALTGRVKRQAEEMLVLEKVRTNHQRKKSECERAEGSLARVKKETSGRKKPEASELEAFSQSYDKKQAELLAARQSLTATQAEFSGIQSEIAILENGLKLAVAREKKALELEGKLKELLGGKTIAQLDAEAQNLKEEIDRLTALHASLHAEIAQLSNAVETLAGTHAKCPVCDSDLSEGKAGKLSGEKGKALGEMKAQLASSGASLKEKKLQLSSLEKQSYDHSLFSAELARLKAEGIETVPFKDEIGKKGHALKDKENALKQAQQGVSGLEAELEKARAALDEAKRTAKLFSELDESAEKLALAQDELAKLSFSEPDYEAKRKDYEELRLEAAKLEAELSGAQSQAGLMEELVNSLHKELSYLQEKEKLAAAYGTAAQSMAIYRNSLASAQSELRSNLVEEINSALCEVWPAVYPYSDYNGVKIEADEKDYRLLMEKNGAWREVDSIASGGERACLCLALRIAFATVLTPDIGVLILDEPTHNLDSDAVLLLSEAINKKIPSIVEQTFVITHDAALGETSEGTVFRLERDKSKNESTRVEKAD